ncbi:MAG: pantoate--beta-alanine ligase [Planctomycetota bacterium]
MKPPLIVHDVAGVRQWRTDLQAREGGRTGTVGFVPTMGALHDGHLSLMRAARESCDHVVVSIFVNPTQFGPNEDFDQYPRDVDGDVAACAAAGVDLVWFGDRTELYPPGFATQVELPALAAELCGRGRPGHFAGVALIVLKLWQVVAPDRAFFGWKDYQQFVILQQLARDLHLCVDVVGAPIVREKSGLAMSSRNVRLSELGRTAAAVLHQALSAARDRFGAGDCETRSLVHAALELILAEPRVELEYLEVVHPESLQPLTEVASDAVGIAAVIAVAARVEGVRLIDNIFLQGNGA